MIFQTPTVYFLFAGIDERKSTEPKRVINAQCETAQVLIKSSINLQLDVIPGACGSYAYSYSTQSCYIEDIHIRCKIQYLSQTDTQALWT
jgi:hypothetical protein